MKSPAKALLIVTGSLLSLSTTLHGEDQVIASSPSDFSLKQGIESIPTLATFTSSLTNAWGIALDAQQGILYWTDPTARKVFSLPLDDLGGSPVEILSSPTAVYHGITWDSGSERLYLLDSDSDSLLRLDPSNPGSIETFAWNTTRPCDLAICDGEIYVTDSGADSLFIGSSNGGTPTPLSGAATEGIWGIAANPKDGNIYYSSFTQGKIYKLVKSTSALMEICDNLEGPRGLSFDKNGNLYCLESGTGTVVAVDIANGTCSPTSFATALNGRAFLIFDNQDRDGDFIQDSWEIDQLGNLASGGGDDPDEDGTNTFTEYLFNGSATETDGQPLQALSEDLEGNISASYDALAGSEFSYQVEYTTDFSSWFQLNVTPSITPIPESNYENRAFSFDPSSLFLSQPTELFFRINVEAN